MLKLRYMYTLESDKEFIGMPHQYSNWNGANPQDELWTYKITNSRTRTLLIYHHLFLLLYGSFTSLKFSCSWKTSQSENVNEESHLITWCDVTEAMVLFCAKGDYYPSSPSYKGLVIMHIRYMLRKYVHYVSIVQMCSLKCIWISGYQLKI